MYRNVRPGPAGWQTRINKHGRRIQLGKKFLIIYADEIRIENEKGHGILGQIKFLMNMSVREQKKLEDANVTPKEIAKRIKLDDISDFPDIEDNFLDLDFVQLRRSLNPGNYSDSIIRHIMEKFVSNPMTSKKFEFIGEYSDWIEGIIAMNVKKCRAIHEIPDILRGVTAEKIARAYARSRVIPWLEKEARGEKHVV